MEISQKSVLSYPNLGILLEPLFISYDHGNSMFALVQV
jgi:hypothetical protein